MDLPKFRRYLHWIFTTRGVVPLLAMMKERGHLVEIRGRLGFVVKDLNQKTWVLFGVVWQVPANVQDTSTCCDTILNNGVRIGSSSCSCSAPSYPRRKDIMPNALGDNDVVERGSRKNRRKNARELFQSA